MELLLGIVFFMFFVFFAVLFAVFGGSISRPGGFGPPTHDPESND
ncbi:MAG: hypothetical protein WDZ40_01875 [Candidatus Spechtbacterales bacterium]